jgi:hypothetical protein
VSKVLEITLKLVGDLAMLIFLTRPAEEPALRYRCMLDSFTGDKLTSGANPSIVSNFMLSEELVAALVLRLL